MLQAAVLINGRAQVQLFGFLHQGQHHIGLAPFVDLIANELIRLGPLG